MGTRAAGGPLYPDVVRKGVRARADPRLPPVTVADWPELEVKVAVLTEPAPFAVTGLDALLAGLRPGVDGLLFVEGARRSTVPPAAWAPLAEATPVVGAGGGQGGRE